MNKRVLDGLLYLCTGLCVGNALLARALSAEQIFGRPLLLFLILLLWPVLQRSLVQITDKHFIKRPWRGYVLFTINLLLLFNVPVQGLAETLLVAATWIVVHLALNSRAILAAALLATLTPLQTLTAMATAPGPLWLLLFPLALLLCSSAWVLLSQRHHFDSIRSQAARAHVRAWEQSDRFQLAPLEWLTRIFSAVMFSVGIFTLTLLIYPALVAIPRPYFNPRSPQLNGPAQTEQEERDAQELAKDETLNRPRPTFPGDIRPGGRLGDLNYETVMTVQAYRDSAPEQAIYAGPLYLRGICLDTFTETGLRSSPERHLVDLVDGADGRKDGWITFDEQQQGTGILLHTVQNVLRVPGSEAAVLFAVHPIRAMQLDAIRHEPDFMLALPTGVDLAQVGFRQRMNQHPLERRGPATLRASHPDPRYLQLPSMDEDAQWIADLSRRLSASAKTDLERVRAIVGSLHFGFDYSTKTNDVPGTQGIVQFLRREKGHCTSFSAAAVFLLRCQGIPARVATGFLGDEYDQQRQLYSLSRRNGHAWIEVYFEGLGWQTFDPTPASQRTEALRMALAGEDDGLQTWAADLISDLSAWARSGADEAYFSPLLETLMRAPRAAFASALRNPGAVVLLGVVVLLAILGLLRPRRTRVAGVRKQTSPPHQKLYERWLTTVEDRGTLRSKAQTIREWTRALSLEEAPQLAQDLPRVVNLFYGSRFGERELNQKELDFIEAWIDEAQLRPTP
jgi:hypothetical protein